MSNGRQVQMLTEYLLDALQEDWVMVPAMAWWAAKVLGTGDTQEQARLVRETLLALVDHPRAKVVNGDMTHAFADKAELEGHLDAEWPDNGEPIENDIGWLVDRDFDVSQSPMRPV